MSYNVIRHYTALVFVCEVDNFIKKSCVLLRPAASSAAVTPVILTNRNEEIYAAKHRKRISDYK